ncbi:DNA-binding transcriptional regulator GbsR, MarR family [Streptoalloteichus tenebrarius]|uniref:DNA-binding transcriptional regulator GbsR, MarR family n=1 Tax=Streptoalloteichus tenebrarius (strain ATCC 17920 / DSM 40477 / JCM 4838 / CBS 697.72 / NBRC 16177 / NCIMB 11028 / NRRL B-12390 / A12253. 1 / ISP 5477) TaxID=1933 RepID=A0ABT1HSS2_STRSD|nr:transcriptional regulator [Streptoalloteichus tenebrarius]MCP2258568.1 DNA-binding transcriptional regulator GbsR, MarR family [Streptoalloteichus tenebrarius]BFF04063.1 MarR family transcriptional regulator [Streptoalloteichus tenebrarius]
MAREDLLASWVEHFAMTFERDGLPLIAGRILGYLLICNPPERTAAELSAALEASSGSISTNLRLLGGYGLVRKQTRRGRLAALYRVDEQRWVDFVQGRLEAIAGVRELTAGGLRLMSGDPERAERLRVVDEVYASLSGALDDLRRRLQHTRDAQRS